MASVGKSPPHDTARGHVTGTAPYIDDYVPMQGELSVEYVGSPVAHGTIKSIDVSAARAAEGVVGVYTAKDLKGHNHFGAIFPTSRCWRRTR